MKRGCRLHFEVLEDRATPSGAVHLQGVFFRVFLPSGPILVQGSGVLTPGGRLNVKVDQDSAPLSSVSPDEPVRILLFTSSSPHAPRVELTGFIANNQIHAIVSDNPTEPPPVP